MILRAFRWALFKHRRRALLAQGSGGLLEEIGDGLILPGIPQFSAVGASGAYRVFVVVPPSPPPPCCAIAARPD